ncbi:nicotinate-nucleotide adenylyltransferase [Panacibacter ginsenosidivorans]|uniref:Probable nicotinate-nucleotide adenylyltransferase n=1 Tax=Panacibacter ginsenosidivorans TaxID=1813871 RepID=A0A5B8V9U5_9BACT|nr:nicotinate (nicotinamide) nucleotide adenylyltransferase [Panacibacter ginsenosidivorans]QEC68102.1 nicotinate-nucleotide adenylyltransferase [Panacibacter ginsenosidivorans]
MKIGLYFGSFNPIHIGHLIIANHVLNSLDIKKIWFIVSPQNPLKHSNSLLNEYQRLHLVRLAIEDNLSMVASDVEFKLPRPSYTIDTLAYLKEKYPGHEFSIIMGSDSFQNIHKWKNPERIIANYRIIIYNRPGFEIKDSNPNTVILKDAPRLDISATAIRELIKNGKSIRYLVPDKPVEEIKACGYYKK